MADSDYTVRGESALTTVAFLVADIGHMASTITITGLKVTDPTATAIGRPAMIDDEIVRVDGVSGSTVTISRGCADTIPAAHLAGSPVWFFDMEMGTDGREYLAGETISVKPLVHTPNSIPMTVASVPPRQLTFNQRFHRPYPPAEFKCKGDYWFTGVKTLPVGTPELVWTWNHRDRLLQADQLIDHNDADIGPEAGTTYTARVYTSDDVLVRTVAGITGKTWSYSRELAEIDLAATSTGYVIINSVRDGLESLYGYRTEVDVVTGVLVDLQYLNVVLQLPMNGANGSTVFQDNSANVKPVSITGGTKISTAQSKFGGSSALFENSGDVLQIASNTDFDLGNTYTIEFWVYNLNTTAVGGVLHRGFYTTGSNTWDSLAFSVRGIGGSVRFYFYGTTNANEQLIDVAGAMPQNTWQHIAMVRNGSTGTVYINGTLAGTVNGLNTPAPSTRPLKIGVWDYSSGNEYFKGYLEDLRITKGIARYTSNFVPSTNAFPVVSTKTIDPFFNDVSLLIGFDGGSGASLKDNSRFNRSTSIGGGASINAAPGVFGGSSFLFDGVNDYFTVPTAPEFVFGLNDFTIEFFFKANVINTFHALVYTGLYETNQLSLRINDANKIQSFIHNGTNTYGLPTGSTSIPINEWLHIAICANAGVLRTFLNGVLETSMTYDLPINCADSLIFGSQIVTGTPGLFPNGYMDELRVTTGVARYTANFKAPVSPYADTAPIYSAIPPKLYLRMHGVNGSTAIVDSSQTPLTVTPVGGAALTTAVSQSGVSSCEFNGAGAYVSAGTPGNWKFMHDGTSWTCEGYFRLRSLAKSSVLFGNTVTTNDRGFVIYLSQNTGLVNVQIYTGVPSEYVVTGGSTVAFPVDNKFHHFAVTFDYSLASKNCVVYLDGNVIAELNKTGSTPSASDPVYPLEIGGMSNWSGLYNMDGYAEGVRVTQGKAVYTETFTPPTFQPAN